MNAVIRVGDDRGFIVKDAGRAGFGWHNERVVITAAHFAVLSTVSCRI